MYGRSKQSLVKSVLVVEIDWQLEAVTMSRAEFFLRFVGIVLAFALVGGTYVKFFARALSFTQAFTISLAAYAVAVGLFIAYTQLKLHIVIPSWVDLGRGLISTQPNSD